MQFSMMSSENLSFIYNLNTSLQMREHPLQYASTDKNKNLTIIGMNEILGKAGLYI